MDTDVLTHAGLAHWAEAGLAIFFVTFIGITIWSLTRTREEVEEWSNLPLQGGETAVSREDRHD